MSRHIYTCLNDHVVENRGEQKFCALLEIILVLKSFCCAEEARFGKEIPGMSSEEWTEFPQQATVLAGYVIG